RASPGPLCTSATPGPVRPTHARSTPSATMTATRAVCSRNRASPASASIQSSRGSSPDVERRRLEADERQPFRRALEHHPQGPIAHQREVRRHDRRLDGAARDFDLGARAEVRVAMNLTQRQHREADGPQAEAADADLALRDQARVLERVAQMRVRDAEQMIQAFAETARQMPVLEPLEAEAVLTEDRARQPARVRASIVPDILQDVRHLQALPERDRKPHEPLAMPLEIRAAQQEELGEHLADDACDVVA